MDFKKTLWKDLIDKTKKKLNKYPIKIDLIHDKYSSLRFEYSWINKEDFDKEVDAKIENIILEAEAKSEDLLLYKKNKNPQIETFSFPPGKTFFGLIVHAYGIKKSDIKQLPFYEFWEASAVGSTCAIFNDEVYVYKHDWENFCRSFIVEGKHRYM